MEWCLTKKNWDQRDFPNEGDRNDDAVYTAVGRALSSWESIEFWLSRLFGLFVSTGPEEPAIRGYGAIHGFEARLTMVKAAGEAYFNVASHTRLGCKIDFNPYKSNFKAMRILVKNLSPRRNEIAHGAVRYTPPLIVTSKRKFREKYPRDCILISEVAGWALYPNYASTDRTDINYNPEYIYSSIEILYYAEQFNLAKAVVGQFYHNIWELKNSIIRENEASKDAMQASGTQTSDSTHSET